MGSFFKFRPSTGSFESNPPFVNDVMTANVKHIVGLLDAAATSKKPLSFIIVVPAWDDDKCESYQITIQSRYLRHTLWLGRKQHQ
ncbi:MAG: hypothetical protein CL534_13720 [Ahrensia sp.]|nr:hypothetical protein [Ahrensia sp.]